jgi:SpoVK/Ycf46/Vps4 family AAA+-type ATPase
VLSADFAGPLAITLCRERMPRLDFRPLVHIELEPPSREDRVELWRDAVPSLVEADALALAERYAIAGGIISLAARSVTLESAGDPNPGVQELDRAVQAQLHGRVQRLGRRIETPYTLDDLVADDDLLDSLCEVLACVRKRREVRDHLGLRGAQGVSVLFSGEPGVGKTMSATVLARALELAIYEIDLSQVMSKWVGETEKNLAEVFDAAEPGHIVLLFNEADSLFGKRTVDVKSSNDRYANLETNYLLQRLERFNGLAILTTNLGNAIDPAFRRRFAYDVQFSFPSAPLRAELWRRAIPEQVRGDDLSFDELGERFEIAGGFIKVAAERAAFVAATIDQPIGMELVTSTVERMYHERGKLAAIGKLE